LFCRFEREHEDLSIANAHTVFVGNVPSGCTQKVIIKICISTHFVFNYWIRNLKIYFLNSVKLNQFDFEISYVILLYKNSFFATS
jgi:hypothetical protein